MSDLKKSSQLRRPIETGNAFTRLSDSLRIPGRRGLVCDHDEGVAAVLSVVPGMEQLFLIHLLRMIYETATDPLHKSPRQKGAPRTARTGEDGRPDRPHGPTAKMLERVPIGVGDNEPGLAFGLRPVERERDLVRGPLHSSCP